MRDGGDGGDCFERVCRVGHGDGRDSDCGEVGSGAGLGSVVMVMVMIPRES